MQRNENRQRARGGDECAQQSQDTKANADVVPLDLVNGESVVVPIGGTNTRAGEGGTTGQQHADNRQRCTR